MTLASRVAELLDRAEAENCNVVAIQAVRHALRLDEEEHGVVLPLVTEQLLALIGELVDPDPCYFDRHGYCQAHGWLQEGECADGRAQKLLAEAGQGATA